MPEVPSVTTPSAFKVPVVVMLPPVILAVPSVNVPPVMVVKVPAAAELAPITVPSMLPPFTSANGTTTSPVPEVVNVMSWFTAASMVTPVAPSMSTPPAIAFSWIAPAPVPAVLVTTKVSAIPPLVVKLMALAALLLVATVTLLVPLITSGATPVKIV